MENFSLSLIEVLATNAQTDSIEIKKMLIRTALRECKTSKRMRVPMSLYKPLIVHFDTKELYHKYKTIPVRSGKASRTGGKTYPVSSGIRFPMERNMQY